MSDTTTEAKPTESTATTQGDPANEPLGEGGKKALDAERARAKELEKQLNAATAKLTEIERANESAIERAQREAQEAKSQVDKLPSMVADQLRGHLAEVHGISDEDRELYLTSNDPAVLLKQAAGLVARTTSAPETRPGPRPDLTQGGNSTPALNSNALENALRDKLGIA